VVTPNLIAPVVRSVAEPGALTLPPAPDPKILDPEARGKASGDEGSVPGLQRRRADGDCNGGKRVVSTYYWEGKHTASGQPFNPQGLTAAHRTLPFGTQLTVSNPRNGKSVVVVINDRGPFVSGISLDLSLGAAKAIGMNGTGTVCVQ
jgi:rare lipoprotein A